jgi:DNA-binding NarL/FixJ family response regulator
MGALREILLVDSHRVFRRAVRETIARRCPGVVVLEAPSGEDAIRKVKRHRPGLIFTDIDIPGCRVLDLLQRIREAYPAAMIVVLTSYDQPEYREAALANGANLFFSKSASSGSTIEKIIEAELLNCSNRVTVQNRERRYPMTYHDQYQKLAEAKFEEIVARLQQLKAQAKQGDAKVRIEFERQIDQFQDRKAVLENKLSDLKNAGENAYAELKTEVEAALNDMKSALEEAAAKFKG